MKINLNKRNKGITLVALVITIIILLILAGITITQLTNNGLFEKAKQSQKRYGEAEAKEKLQMALMTAAADKQQDKSYNKDEYLTKKLEDEKFIVNDNIVIVDGYCFEIDRDKLEIVKSMGESKNNVLISYSVYDNQDNENIKTKVKFYNEKGITSIELPDGTIIDGEGKKEVIIDCTTNTSTSKQFKVILNDNSEMESNLKITENGIKETFKIKETEIEDNEENADKRQFTNLTIDYENKQSTDITYYKIGETGGWYIYTDTLQLDMAAIQNVTDATGNEGDTVVYLKKEDANGNIVTISKTVHIQSTAYNVLSNIRYRGESSDKYFNINRPANEMAESYIRDNYIILDFGYGHGSGSGGYEAKYILNYPELQLKTSNKLMVVFNNYIEGGDVSNTYAKIYYTDGTSSEEKISEYEFDEQWLIFGYTEYRTSLTMELDENKTVDYVELKISLYDSQGGSAFGAIRDIIFLGASK